MMKLPFATHRGLIEPLTKDCHLKKLIIKRFLVFIEIFGRSENH